MTLLEKLADVISSGVAGDVESRKLAEQVLSAILSPPQSLVNRMGAKALDGPQPMVGQTIYPAAMWRAGLQFILEEGDRGPEADPEPEDDATEGPPE